MSEYKYVPERNPMVLATMADCASPDGPDSAGAEFLVAVADAVEDQVDRDVDHCEDISDAADEIADLAVPIYTHDLWSTFVELAAYEEDPTDLGVDASDMEQAARVCLYIIAARLAFAMLENAQENNQGETR